MNKIGVLLLFFFAVIDLSWAKRVSFPYAGRTFTLVLPAKIKKAPLLVLIHGCSQTAKIILDGTGLDQLAEENGFVILAPDQLPLYNPTQCWNWFLDYEQRRGLPNEMGQIIATINLIFGKYDIDRERVFVAGMSSGAATAHNLSACYPDYFSGSAIHSGLAYKSAENIFEAQTVFTSENQKSPDLLGQKMFKCARTIKNHRLEKMIIIHGDEDKVVNPIHAELTQATNEAWRDYLDDGVRNHSVRGKRSVLINADGEVTHTSYPHFNEQVLLIKGMGHAWGGGLNMPYFDPDAPSSNEAILTYFGLLK